MLGPSAACCSTHTTSCCSTGHSCCNAILSAAGYYISQDASDTLMFCGIDKRIHRDIYVLQKEGEHVADSKLASLHRVFHHQDVDIQRKETNNEKRGYNDHGFDEFHLIRLFWACEALCAEPSTL